MDLAIGIIGALAAAGAAAAAFGSWTAARKANDTAAALAVIEADRRHEELAPVFDLACEVTTEHFAMLRVTLTGGRLEQLDAVTVTILDEAGTDHERVMNNLLRHLPAGLTEEQLQALVWGPVEFNANLPRIAVSNRESRPRAYSRVSGRNWARLVMRPTRPASWMSSSPQDWCDRYKDQPARLLLTCRRDGLHRAVVRAAGRPG